MIYRPQFAYPAVPGEEEFTYYFSSFNTPALALRPMQPGDIIPDILLQLQPDAPFFLRAVNIFAWPWFNVQLRDSGGKFLSDDFLDTDLTYQASGTFGPGFAPVMHEPELPCDAGGVLFLYVKNISAVPVLLTGIEVILRGTKQFKQEAA